MSTAVRDRWLAINFAATIFVSAFLLFQVQPLVSKYILPWFGGSPAVWTTCMLFFQSMLFGGYAYAHLSQRWLAPRAQALVHLVLIVAALLLLHVVPTESWKPTDSSHPVANILLLLAATVGFPYFVLSSTGPLLQAWFAHSYPGKVPYRLYALSNVGSLLALVSYPFYFERWWNIHEQATFWWWGFIAFAALCSYAAVSLWMLFRGAGAAEWSNAPVGQGEIAGLEVAADDSPNAATDSASAEETSANNSAADAHPSPLRRLLWLMLPAFASVVLLATTNHVCADVAPMPFLWVVPLSLYLLTFIIAFDHSRWYVPSAFAVLTVLSIYAVAVVHDHGLSRLRVYEFGTAGKVLHTVHNFFVTPEMIKDPVTSQPREDESKWRKYDLSFLQFAGLNFVAMFAVCMLCHGELVRLRPHPKYLTSFYLMIAAGGRWAVLWWRSSLPTCSKLISNGICRCLSDFCWRWALSCVRCCGRWAGKVFRWHAKLLGLQF